jgi:predicted ArsR family transcriptional regulator
MASALPDQLATRLRALLRAADHPTGAAGTSADWRAARDRWLDELDPRQTQELTERDIRRLIDFLSEAGPSRASRRTKEEWGRVVDALVPELLFAGQSGNKRD